MQIDSKNTKILRISKTTLQETTLDSVTLLGPLRQARRQKPKHLRENAIKFD